MQRQLHIQQRTRFGPTLSRNRPFCSDPVDLAHGTTTLTRHRLRRCSSANTAASITTTPSKQHVSSSGTSAANGADGATMYLRESADSNAQHNKQFNWYKAWYPLAVLHNLDRDIPSHARVLGMELVVWFDKRASKWRVFQDRCPHRLAPLSEGRLDNKTGNLYCNYHGWQFDGAGACTNIPQLPAGQPLNSKRSCATSYPSCEREGLLWVWPDSSPTAALDSSDPAVWPGLTPELDSQGSTPAQLNKTWYFRDLPVCWLAAKENAFNDCSHDIVLHHGSSPFATRDNAKPIDMRLVDMNASGYTVRESSGQFQDTARFPCGSRRDGTFYAGVAYIVPTGVGTCRQFHCFVTAPRRTLDKATVQQQHKQTGQQQAKEEAAQRADPPKTGSSKTSSSGSKPSVLGLPLWGIFWKASRALSVLKPAWMVHMVSHLLVDADISMQSKVDVQRALDDRVYMPAAADAGPAAFVRWLREFGDQGPPVAKLNDPFLGHTPTTALQLDRRQLLDRYWTHTASCKDCKAAHKQFKVLRQVVGVAAVIAASAAVAAAALVLTGALPAADVAETSAHSVASLLMKNAGMTAVCWLGVAATAAGLVWAAVGRLLESFEFIDYDKHHVSRV